MSMQRERFHQSLVLAKSDGSDSLHGIKRGKTVRSCQKHTKNMKFFERIARFWEQCAWITSESLMSLFYKMTTAIRLRSLILKSDESYSLTVALFWRVTRVNRSQSLFNMSDFERKSKEQKRKFPTLQIPWIWPRNQSTRRDWMTTKKQVIKNLTVNNNKLQFPKECVAKTSDLFLLVILCIGI